MASSVLSAALRAGATALCAATVALAFPGGAGAAPAYPGPQHRQFSVTEAHRFLTVFYGQHGPSRVQRSRDVTPALRKAAAANHRMDLLLCAQNTPRSISVGQVVAVPNSQGRATVTTTYANRRHTSFTAYVSLDARRPMQLSNVNCGLAHR